MRRASSPDSEAGAHHDPRSADNEYTPTGHGRRVPGDSREQVGGDTGHRRDGAQQLQIFRGGSH